MVCTPQTGPYLTSTQTSIPPGRVTIGATEQQTAPCDHFNCMSLRKLRSPGTSCGHRVVHPCLGRHPGPAPRSVVHACIETTPHHFIKYEVDKTKGYLPVDRPRRTYCGQRVAALRPGPTRGMPILWISASPANDPSAGQCGPAVAGHGELPPYGSTVIDSDSTLSPAGSPATS